MSAADLRWPALAQALQAQGFPPVLPHSATADGSTHLSASETERLQATLQALLAQRQRHARLLPALAAKAADEAKQAETAEARTRAQTVQVKALTQQLHDAREALVHEQGLRQAEKTQAEAARTQLEAVVGALHTKAAAAREARKALESENAALKEALAKAAQREDSRNARNARLFEELHHRKAHQRSALDRRVMDVMDMYEARLAAVGAEMRRLRAGQNAGRSDETPAATGAAMTVSEPAETGALAEPLAAAEREVRAVHAHAARLAKQLDEHREKLALAQLELGARPSLNVWRSTQRELQRVKTELGHVRLELQSLTSVQRAEAADGAVKAGGLPAASDDSAAMQADSEFYGLHLYKLKHAAADVLRRRLAALCRLQRVSPDRLVAHTKRCLRQLDAAPELYDYVAAVAQAARHARAHVGGGDASEEPATGLPAAGVPDWSVVDTLQTLSEALVVAEGKRTALDTILQAVRSAVLSATAPHRKHGAGAAGDLPLSQLPAAVASLASALTRLQTASQAWADAEQALSDEVSASDDENDQGGVRRLLHHVASQLGVAKAAGIIPALSKLQGAYAETSTALRTVHETVLPSQRFRSATAAMRAVLKEFRANKRSSHPVLEATAKMLSSDLAGVPAAVARLQTQLQQYETYFPMFQRWTDAVLQATQQESMQDVLVALGSAVQLLDDAAEADAHANTTLNEVNALVAAARESDATVRTITPQESMASSLAVTGRTLLLTEQRLATPDRQLKDEDEEEEEDMAAELFLSHAGDMSTDDVGHAHEASSNATRVGHDSLSDTTKISAADTAQSAHHDQVAVSEPVIATGAVRLEDAHYTESQAAAVPTANPPSPVPVSAPCTPVASASSDVAIGDDDEHSAGDTSFDSLDETVSTASSIHVVDLLHSSSAETETLAHLAAPPASSLAPPAPLAAPPAPSAAQTRFTAPVRSPATVRSTAQAQAISNALRRLPAAAPRAPPALVVFEEQHTLAIDSTTAVTAKPARDTGEKRGAPALTPNRQRAERHTAGDSPALLH